ncbi:MAG TPA: phage major capsid protein [Verrucomicrobiae bacterium]|nr:phage major capsid protein [Verrucomicrobiae bacterium]
MNRNCISFLLLGALCLWPARAFPTDEPAQTVETRLRDRLRDTLLQLRAAETDRAALQAAQAQAADENKALTERLQAVTKQAEANRQAAQTAAQTADGLKAQVSRQEKEIADLKEATESCKLAAAATHKKDAEQIKLADDAVVQLERLVSDRQEKNLELYKTASEILQRYQNFGLGRALAAREPFVGITRVKLENLVQDYKDKLLDSRVTLNEKDLPPYGDKLVNPPRQTAESGSGVAKQTSE